MASGPDTSRSWKVKRRTLTLVLLLTMFGIGAWMARPLWRRGAQNDPMRLGLLYEAFSEFNSKRLDQATALLDRRAAEVQPTALDWMLRARIAESRGQLTEALKHLKRIPDSDPIAAQAWLKAGQIELASRRSGAAETAYRRSIALDPEQVQPHRELAYLYAIQRRKTDCDAQFRALSRLMPLDYVLAFGWCQSYVGIWDPRGPREMLSGFIAQDPSDRSSRLALATSYRLTAEFDESEATLRALPASDADALAIRIESAIDRGDNAKAEELARGGPTDHPRINCLRGKLAMLRLERREAVNYYRAALLADPEDRDANHGLGQALKGLGDPACEEYVKFAARHDELKRMIQASTSTIKTDPQLYFKLGSLCESLRRTDEARAWYRLAIKRDAFDAEAQKALTHLEQAAAESTSKPAERN
jgi:tetratricopeptide (TPR) repeat protein